MSDKIKPISAIKDTMYSAVTGNSGQKRVKLGLFGFGYAGPAQTQTATASSGTGTASTGVNAN